MFKLGGTPYVIRSEIVHWEKDMHDFDHIKGLDLRINLLKMGGVGAT